MFLLHKKRRKKKNTFNFYYLISALCLFAGMVIGYLNTNPETSYLMPDNTEPLYLFKFSLIKHTVLLIFIFFNSFSMLGFPLTATALVVSGYFVTASTATLFINNELSKMDFVIRNFPQTALIMTAVFLLSEAVFEFSHYLFIMIFKTGYKNTFSSEFKRLFIKFIVSLIIVSLAAAYEAFVL